MFKKLAVAIVVAGLFSMNCDDEPKASVSDNTGISDVTDVTDVTYVTDVVNVTDITIDTLCVYSRGYGMGLDGTRVFESIAGLTAFMDSTGYDANDEMNVIKKMEHQPDFTKWRYFGSAGRLDWRSQPKLNISEVNETITINWVRHVPPPSLDGECPQYAPPMSVTSIYSIPFTTKAIEFIETRELFQCQCGRH